MKVNGKKIKLKEKENSHTLMEIPMKEIGKIIKPVEKEYILIQMEQNTMENGLMIINMALELR
jgi:hypothetical protein